MKAIVISRGSGYFKVTEAPKGAERKNIQSKRNKEYEYKSIKRTKSRIFLAGRVHAFSKY